MTTTNPIELPSDGIFRVLLPNGKYSSGHFASTKRGKTWNDLTHFHQHLGQFFYSLKRNEEYVKNFFTNAKIINERTGEEWDLLPYLIQRAALSEDKKNIRRQRRGY